jgi:hypothetical protein
MAHLLRRSVLAGVLLMCAGGLARAQTLDPSSQKALGAVLQLLGDPALRSGAMADNPQSRAADAQIRGLTGGSDALTQQVYELAGQIFEDLTRASGGDAQVISQTLARAQADPAGLAAVLSPRTLERLRALATSLPDQPQR